MKETTNTTLFRNILIRDVEAVVDQSTKAFALTVHVKTTPDLIQSPLMQDYVASRAAMATAYLINEGFIPAEEKWTCVIQSICHV